MNEYIETNRRHWDELVPIHVRSTFYDVPSFKAGRSTLTAIERTELGPVSGKSLLHLQCHFGLDTLSWAREGAIVTGVDFSSGAIRVARDLAQELHLQASFIESDVYKLPAALTGAFDVVFASYGVICWLPDFPLWAQIAASYVKPGGVFYLVDDHPLAAALADDATAASLRIAAPYLAGAPSTYEDDGSYADRGARLRNRRTVEFAHGLGEVVTALAKAGLLVEFLHEFPFSSWQRMAEMEKGKDGFWRLPANESVPFLFSVKAAKPGAS